MHTAIVAEGGGQRGIFTAGVLDAFMDEAFNPFTLGIGPSAGAQNLFTYFIAEQGYARRAFAELTMAPDFFVPYRWLLKRSVIDLDGYFDKSMNDPEYRLPYQHLDAVKTRRQLQFVATCRESLEALYLEPDSSTVMNFLKASSAVPFLYKEGVRLHGRVMVDGGVADPLPVRRAYQQGARRILVIRNTPADNSWSSWSQKIYATRLRHAIVPTSLQLMLQRHEEAFLDAREFLQSPPENTEIVTVAPAKPLQSYAFGSRSAALTDDYKTGQREGQRILDRIGCWQASPAASVVSTPVEPVL